MHRVTRSPRISALLASILAMALACPPIVNAASAVAPSSVPAPTLVASSPQTESLQATAPVAAKTTTIEQDSPLLIYFGPWKESASSRASGGSQKVADAAGSIVFLSFSGTNVRWTGPVGPTYGSAEVYLDGMHVATVSQHALIARMKRTVWASAKLADGPHRLEIRSLPRSADNDGSHVCVDAFTVAGTVDEPTLPFGFTKAEEGDARLTYFGVWKRVAQPSASGGAVRSSTSNGSGVLVAFRGTAITISGPKGETLGRSHVYLDGKLAGSIDQRSTTTVSRQPLWSAIGLASGTHLVEVRPAPTAASPSTVAVVSLDAVLVQGSVLQAPARVEESDSRLGFVGTWTRSTSLSMSGGRFAKTAAGGASVALRFNGTSVRVLGMKSPTSGEAEVVLDGVLRGVINLHASSTRSQQLLWRVSGLSPGLHDLELRVLGTAAPQSRGVAVGIDAFEVQGSVVQAAIPAGFSPAEEDDADLALSAAWRIGASGSMSSGRWAYSDTPGSEFTATFSGSGIRWIGPKSATYGDAEVLVDGVSRGVVSQFGTDKRFRQHVWSATGLAPGQHTLTIRVLDRRDSRGSVKTVAVDSLQVIDGALSTAPRPEGVARIGASDSRTAPLGAWTERRVVAQQGQTELRASDARSRYDMKFRGTQVSWIGPRGPNRGIAEVLIDGVSRGTVDLYACAETDNRVLFSANELTADEHVLSVKFTGRRNRASTSYAVGIGAIDVEGDVLECASRFEDDDWRLVYSGRWSSRLATAASAGRMRATEATLSSLAVRFTGTKLGIVAEVGPASGIASISVDGAAPVEIDLWAPEAAARKLVYSVETLSEGEHTLAITCTGRANPAATGAAVALDAFDIEGTLVPQTAAQNARAVAVDTAIAQLGKRYVWAGVGPTVFDCSGLMLFSYRAAGIKLPHYSGSQWGLSTPKKVTELEPGDLCFDSRPGKIHHVGMYIGDGITINAPGSGRFVEYRAATTYGCFGKLRASLWPQ